MNRLILIEQGENLTTSSHPFTVWITPECLQRLNFYATEALPTEIGGFAKIEERPEEGAVFVTDIFIPKQKATGGTFDVDADMDNEFMRFMIKEGRREELPLWKSMVHSHPVGMGASMSGTDVTAIKGRAEEGECYSLIISATRSADGQQMFMHYCATMYGKQFIWNDIPVQVGWSVERMEQADKVADNSVEVLGATDEVDKALVKDLIREALCTNLPPRWDAEAKELRKEIAAEVKQKLSKPSYGFNPAQGYGRTAPWPKTAQKGAQDVLSPYEQQYLGYADTVSVLEEDLKQVDRLYSIGYDQIDPTTDKRVTKDQAKKARKLHKKRIMELNKELRKKYGVGVGDLVIVDTNAVNSITELDELATVPTEVEGFEMSNGLCAFEVGGEVFYGDELIPVTQYEDIMGWTSTTTEVKV